MVGCDAMQVYVGFDAATAKPDERERARVPHHLIDCVDPRSNFSLADYVRAAERAIAEIAARGRLPIVAGGTGLYLRGLLRGIVDAPPRDATLRERLRRLAARHGAPRLHRWLVALDAPTARRLAPGDTQRVIRGLELALSGGPLWSERLRAGGSWHSDEERYAALKIGVDLERTCLVERLDRRVERFFEAGLVAEVRALLAAGVPAAANAFKAIGYREVLEALDAGIDPETVRDAVRQNTRRYVKRQRSWFRRESRTHWLDAGEGADPLTRRALELCQAHGILAR